MKCPYCGSERIEQGIAWGKTAQMEISACSTDLGYQLVSLRYILICALSVNRSSDHMSWMRRKEVGSTDFDDSWVRGNTNELQCVMDEIAKRMEM